MKNNNTKVFLSKYKLLGFESMQPLTKPVNSNKKRIHWLYYVVGLLAISLTILVISYAILML